MKLERGIEIIDDVYIDFAQGFDRAKHFSETSTYGFLTALIKVRLILNSFIIAMVFLKVAI